MVQELRGLAQEMQATDRKFAHFCRAGVKVAEIRLFRQPVKKSKGRNNGGFPDLLSTMAYQRAVHGNGRFFSYRVRENRRKGG